MQLLVGLGNPGARYQGTRHNIGFAVVERLAEAHNARWRDQFDGVLADITVGSQRALLLKPLTFMNRAGLSVRKAAAFFKISPANVVVVHDEVDLALGDVRLKIGGGEAGHNGLRSVSEQLGTLEYGRLRCGVGRPPPDFRRDLADFVLQAFAPEQAPQVEAMVKSAVQALEMALQVGMPQAMNSTNRRPKN